MLTSSRYQLRTMSEADIPQVSAIEEEAFATQWPRTAYRRELANKLARYLVVVDRTQEPPSAPQRRRSLLDLFHRSQEVEGAQEYVVGYVGVWLMVDEAHIVAIAVRQGYRRQGLGELLLAEAIELALDNQQENMTLEVRRSNLSAQALYEKYRFIKVGLRKRYYSDNREDAVIMSTPPIQDASYREHLDYLRRQFERRWVEGSEA
jgi:ribosomal-protein-alanine N-acetyltransferase